MEGVQDQLGSSGAKKKRMCWHQVPEPECGLENRSCAPSDFVSKSTAYFALCMPAWGFLGRPGKCIQGLQHCRGVKPAAVAMKRPQQVSG